MHTYYIYIKCQQLHGGQQHTGRDGDYFTPLSLFCYPRTLSTISSDSVKETDENRVVFLTGSWRGSWRPLWWLFHVYIQDERCSRSGQHPESICTEDNAIYNQASWSQTSRAPQLLTCCPLIICKKWQKWLKS